jgi:hypothetical protein
MTNRGKAADINRASADDAGRPDRATAASTFLNTVDL